MNPIVDQVSNRRYEGILVPFEWFQSSLFEFESGHVNLNAVFLLADVIYWYRAVVVRDELTGEVIERRQKFAADMLQKSYDLWGRQFNLTKRQVKDAVAFLRDRGLVRTELRTVTSEYGSTLNNITFIEPLPLAIGLGSIEKDAPRTASASVPSDTLNGISSGIATSALARSGVCQRTSQRATRSTEITTEITTNTKHPPTSDVSDEAASPPSSAPVQPPVMVFKCIGGRKNKSKTWELTQSAIDELQETFTGVNVLAQCRVAMGWAKNNPAKRKTADRMSHFLWTWMQREQNTRGGKSAGNGASNGRYRGLETERAGNTDRPSVPQLGIAA